MLCYNLLWWNLSQEFIVSNTVYGILFHIQKYSPPTESLQIHKDITILLQEAQTFYIQNSDTSFIYAFTQTKLIGYW